MIKITSEDLQDLAIAADTMEQTIKGEDVLRVAGFSMEETIRQQLARIASDPSFHETARSLGAEPSGLYERAADSVESPVIESDGVSVSIPEQGFAQRYFGGTIEAPPGGFLTIPATAEAYGKRARDFDNLRLIIFGDTELAALVAPSRSGGKTDEGDVYYWLVRSVTQEGNKKILPEDEEILEPALQNVVRYIERIWDERMAA
jgi:hypothetical protein